LRDLVWVYEKEVSYKPHKVICMHGSFNIEVSAEEQLKALRARDITNKILQVEGKPGRYHFCSMREDRLHPELEGKAIHVSGHFGYRMFDGDRIINDRSGGCSDRLIEAVVLPERTIIDHEGKVTPKHMIRGNKVYR